jgi:hypothetical protein
VGLGVGEIGVGDAAVATGVFVGADNVWVGVGEDVGETGTGVKVTVALGVMVGRTAVEEGSGPDGPLHAPSSPLVIISKMSNRRRRSFIVSLESVLFSRSLLDSSAAFRYLGNKVQVPKSTKPESFPDTSTARK